MATYRCEECEGPFGEPDGCTIILDSESDKEPEQCMFTGPVEPKFKRVRERKE